MKVSGYLALALIALCVAEAAMINYLFHHRTIQIHVDGTQKTQLQLPDTVITPDSDAYAIRAFPSGRQVCTYADTICYIRI